MPLPEKQNQTISLAEASKLTAKYRSTSPTSSKAQMFWKNEVQKILDQQSCVSLRCYFGTKDDGTPCLILVGADADGNDLESGPLVEDGLPCPPFCPSSSSLSG